MILKNKKVLLVEDYPAWIKIIKEDLGGAAEVLSATTVEEAEKMFEDNPDIALIIMDACVPGDEINTLPLVKKIRETFTGPIIAISANDLYRKKLVEAGCTCECEKKKVRSMIRHLNVLDTL